MGDTSKQQEPSIEVLHDLADAEAEQWIIQEFGSPPARISRPDFEREARARLYSKRELQRIVGHLGRLSRTTRGQVIDLLEDAAEFYAQEQAVRLHHKAVPPPSKQEKQFHGINRACRTLFASLGLKFSKDVTIADIPGHLRPVISLGAAIDGVDPASRLISLVRIAQMSNLMRQRARLDIKRARQRRDNGGPPKHQGDWVFHQFLRRLMLAWYVVHGTLPGFSRPSGGGVAGGPFIRLVQAAMAPLGESKSADAIAGTMASLR